MLPQQIDTEKQRMITEAEQYAEADRKRREEAEQLNNADAICYQAEPPSPWAAAGRPP